MPSFPADGKTKRTCSVGVKRLTLCGSNGRALDAETRRPSMQAAVRDVANETSLVEMQTVRWFQVTNAEQGTGETDGSEALFVTRR